MVLNMNQQTLIKLKYTQEFYNGLMNLMHKWIHFIVGHYQFIVLFHNCNWCTVWLQGPPGSPGVSLMGQKGEPGAPGSGIGRGIFGDPLMTAPPSGFTRPGEDTRRDKYVWNINFGSFPHWWTFLLTEINFKISMIPTTVTLVNLNFYCCV